MYTYVSPENAKNVIYGSTTAFMNTSGIYISWNRIAYIDDVWKINENENTFKWHAQKTCCGLFSVSVWWDLKQKNKKSNC